MAICDQEEEEEEVEEEEEEEEEKVEEKDSTPADSSGGITVGREAMMFSRCATAPLSFCGLALRKVSRTGGGGGGRRPTDFFSLPFSSCLRSCR